MEAIAQVKCEKCKTAAQLSVTKAVSGQPSILLTATSITMPCGHHCSDDKRWSGQVAEIKLEMVSK